MRSFLISSVNVVCFTIHKYCLECVFLLFPLPGDRYFYINDVNTQVEFKSRQWFGATVRSHGNSILVSISQRATKELLVFSFVPLSLVNFDNNLKTNNTSHSGYLYFLTFQLRTLTFWMFSRLVLPGITGGLNITHLLLMLLELAFSQWTASKHLWSTPPAEQVSYCNNNL